MSESSEKTNDHSYISYERPSKTTQKEKSSNSSRHKVIVYMIDVLFTIPGCY